MCAVQIPAIRSITVLKLSQVERVPDLRWVPSKHRWNLLSTDLIGASFGWSVVDLFSQESRRGGSLAHQRVARGRRAECGKYSGQSPANTLSRLQQGQRRVRSVDSKHGTSRHRDNGASRSSLEQGQRRVPTNEQPSRRLSWLPGSGAPRKMHLSTRTPPSSECLVVTIG